MKIIFIFYSLLFLTVSAILILIWQNKQTINKPDKEIFPEPILPEPQPSQPEPQPEPETKLKKPENIPQLREYDIDKSSDLWKAKNPESYIIPYNEWVIYYASQLFIDENGIVRWIEKDEKDWENPPFTVTYISDKDFPNADYWQNPDYYLYGGMKGDCEDFGLALTSMMLSGEMSVIKNGKLIKEKISAKTVGGYIHLEKTYRHIWTEYTINQKTYIGEVGYDPGTGSSLTYYRLKEEEKYRVPFDEFTDKYYRKVY